MVILSIVSVLMCVLAFASATQYYYKFTFAHVTFYVVAEESGIDCLKIISVEGVKPIGTRDEWNWYYFQSSRTLSPELLTELYFKNANLSLAELFLGPANEYIDIDQLNGWGRRLVREVSRWPTLRITHEPQTVCHVRTYCRQVNYGIGLTLAAINNGLRIQLQGITPDVAFRPMILSAITQTSPVLEELNSEQAEWIPIYIYQITKYTSNTELWYKIIGRKMVDVKIFLTPEANTIENFRAAVYQNFDEPNIGMIGSLGGLYNSFTMYICDDAEEALDLDKIVAEEKNYELHLKVAESSYSVRKEDNLGGRNHHFVAVVRFWILKTTFQGEVYFGFVSKCDHNASYAYKQLEINISLPDEMFYLCKREKLMSSTRELSAKFTNSASELTDSALAEVAGLLTAFDLDKLEWSPINITSVDRNPSESLARLSYSEPN